MRSALLLPNSSQDLLQDPPKVLRIPCFLALGSLPLQKYCVYHAFWSIRTKTYQKPVVFNHFLFVKPQASSLGGPPGPSRALQDPPGPARRRQEPPGATRGPPGTARDGNNNKLTKNIVHKRVTLHELQAYAEDCCVQYMWTKRYVRQVYPFR